MLVNATIWVIKKFRIEGTDSFIIIGFFVITFEKSLSDFKNALSILRRFSVENDNQKLSKNLKFSPALHNFYDKGKSNFWLNV